ncbi:MAG: tripartite tricarboxylate transporter substrate-binding protein, partial [Burkholderiales bacterium]
MKQHTRAITTRQSSTALFTACLLVAASTAGAQAWPAKPVRMVLSQPPASSPDIVARLLGERLTRQWGHPVVVENKPGGQNVIGAQRAATAVADGYTYYYATTAALVINAYTFKTLPYDPRKDFAPVGMIGQSPFIIAVHADLP